jgi:hypothetical protein
MPKDEDYIIARCDKVLGQRAIRHKRFDFLVGHKSLKSGRRSRLPVDAFYPSLKLVIEYRERQHIETVLFWDNRKTCCGCTRGKQRKAYDEIRRRKLPKNGLNLIELDFRMFPHNSSKRLLRNLTDDEAILRTKLKKFIGASRVAR